MLVRLLYASRARAGFDDRLLHDILHQASTSNPAQGITGALCCSQGVFLQVLEGGRDAVNRLYGRIVADPRHTDVVLLSYEEIGERRFAQWSMGRVDVERLNPAVLLKYSERAALDPYAVGGKASMALLEDLVASASVIGPG
jgi:hypothetical protein